MWYYRNMRKPTAVLPKKKRGRPATGRDPVTAIRLSGDIKKRVDSWAAKQEDKPGRSEAIRRLVELGLKVKATENASGECQARDYSGVAFASEGVETNG